MKYIHPTTSLCNVCYRHLPAHVYEKEGQILISKRCDEHGEQTGVVEIDTAFYYGLEHYRDIESFDQVLFEASDRCQLNCPHCYHLPDNKIKDKPIKELIDQIRQFPRTSTPMIAGAEPTLRSDFVELCSEIGKLEFKNFSLLSNGIKFADIEFAKSCYKAGLKEMCFGLNHPSYQGEKIHEKQLQALTNLIAVGFYIGYVGYTIEDYKHLEFILKEIQSIQHDQINHFRIRCGSFIGRSSDKQRSYLSTLIKKIRDIVGDNVKFGKYDDNPYHVMLEWGNVRLRLIQWPDVTNIDLEELKTGPWCQFYDGPITNFVHQVITRDAYKNMRLFKLDEAPIDYHYRTPNSAPYWKVNWKGIVEIDRLPWIKVKSYTKKTIGIKELK